MSQLKVLIVEDDATIQEMYGFKLERAGYATARASDGVQGLKTAQTFTPDVILLDLRMPHMSGDQMLQKLRAEDWGKAIRVIILTNISRSEAPSVLRFLNVDRYIVKAHHTPSQIVDVVKEVLK